MAYFVLHGVICLSPPLTENSGIDGVARRGSNIALKFANKSTRISFAFDPPPRIPCFYCLECTSFLRKITVYFRIMGYFKIIRDNVAALAII